MDGPLPWKSPAMAKKKKKKRKNDPFWKLSARDRVFLDTTKKIFLEPQMTVPPDQHLLL